MKLNFKLAFFVSPLLTTNMPDLSGPAGGAGWKTHSQRVGGGGGMVVVAGGGGVNGSSRKVVIIPMCPHWPQEFQEERFETNRESSNSAGGPFNSLPPSSHSCSVSQDRIQRMFKVTGAKKIKQ